MNYNFEWDLNKDKSNYLKHKINFESASGVLKIVMQFLFMMKSIAKMKKDG
jgi:uncharacterized DUF497 family protein